MIVKCRICRIEDCDIICNGCRALIAEKNRKKWMKTLSKAELADYKNGRYCTYARREDNGFLCENGNRWKVEAGEDWAGEIWWRILGD